MLPNCCWQNATQHKNNTKYHSATPELLKGRYHWLPKRVWNYLGAYNLVKKCLRKNISMSGYILF